MHGPTCVFWANLTSFSLQLEDLRLSDEASDLLEACGEMEAWEAACEEKGIQTE